jgi:LysR family glycine cleavage system transcriptional activator
MKNLHQSLPSLHGLIAFEAAARHLSFHRAAEELFLSPSAVSHRVRKLEEELGCALFLRTTRRVSLTPEGAALAGPVGEGLARLRAGVDALAAAAEQGPLTVSCSPSFAIKWLVPRLDRFRAAHPGIDLRISASDRLVDPAREAVDACVRFGPGGYPGLEVQPLAEERVFPVCSPHLLAAGPPLERPEDLARHTLLHDMVLADHALRVDWRRWLAAAAAAGVDARGGLRFSHASLALEAAMAGQGVALARGTLVRGDLAAGRLVKPFEVELDSGLSYWLVTAPAAAPRPRLEAFRGWLLAEIGAA